MTKDLKPPFTLETATAKVQRGEDLWNSRNPQKVALAYTPDCVWRNRDLHFQGRDAIIEFLSDKWEKELEYKLKKELFTFSGNRIAVHFEYEWRDEKGQWYRSHGNEHWDFDEDGLMRHRDASINDEKINEGQRRL